MRGRQRSRTCVCVMNQLPHYNASLTNLCQYASYSRCRQAPCYPLARGATEPVRECYEFIFPELLYPTYWHVPTTTFIPSQALISMSSLLNKVVAAGQLFSARNCSWWQRISNCDRRRAVNTEQCERSMLRRYRGKKRSCSSVRRVYLSDSDRN
jgi:hypothetical protein